MERIVGCTLAEGRGNFVPKMASSDPIQLDQDMEGEQIVSRNYRFIQVGQPVPIQPPADSVYDSQNPPSQPLAVSQRFRLLFIAHSNGHHFLLIPPYYQFTLYFICFNSFPHLFYRFSVCLLTVIFFFSFSFVKKMFRVLCCEDK